jgi:transposase
MPLRPFSREQSWLLPPSLDELVPADHPARFVALFVDSLDRTAWAEMGVDPDGEPLGAPAYHPEALLCVWIYGFLSGIRSARKLEVACRDQLPYLWLTGCQQPDHNTLWRFYQANRKGLRKLLKRSVQTAMRLDLVELAVQAVDGTKIGGNASRYRSYKQKELAGLLKRTEAAIAELEAQNATAGESEPARLPQRLGRREALREQVRAALAQVQAEEGPSNVNLTDGDARLMKGRQGCVAGYNAQVVVTGVEDEVSGGKGILITAAEVVNEPDDHAQLIPMLEAAEAVTGERAEVLLADGGYHSGANLEEGARRGVKVLMPEAQEQALKDAYHKERFEYDEETDSYTCPMGQVLSFKRIKRTKGEPEKRVYGTSKVICRACPAFGQCTQNRDRGRTLEVSRYEKALREQRVLMATERAKEIYRRRKEIVEPVFGILKEMQGARRFLLRGLENVRAEWALLATAFNLGTLMRIWQQRLRRGHNGLAATATW